MSTQRETDKRNICMKNAPGESSEERGSESWRNMASVGTSV